MKLVLISTSIGVALLAVAVTHVLPSMSGLSKSREYAQSTFTVPAEN